jgi:multidrug efflux system outer membrane protein
LILSGCFGPVGPDYVAPALETPDAYSRETPAPVGATEAAYWWRGFNDALLNDLVVQALAANLEIAAAEARLGEARALVDVARAGGGPSLDAGGDASGSARVVGKDDGDSDSEGAVAAGLLFSWTPDLFGGQRREVEAAEAEVRRRALLRDDLARITAADVVRRYLEIRRDNARLEIIDASLNLQRQTFEIVRRRYEVGLAAQLDVSRAEAELAATRASRGPLQRDLGNAEAALAVLVNRPLGSLLEWPVGNIPNYGGGPAIGLPRDLLRLRPDVQASEAELARATAEIGVAEAELYPQLTIPGALTGSITGLGTSNVVEALIATLSASLDIPLFDSGGRRAVVAAAEARAQEALLSYRQTLLNAVADVERALARLKAAQEASANLRSAVAASEVAFEQARQLYTQGLLGFLDVLIAERVFLQNQQNLAAAEAEVGLAIADLYSAVGAPFLRSV